MVITILIKMSVLGTPTVASTLIFFLTRKEIVIEIETHLVKEKHR